VGDILMKQEQRDVSFDLWRKYFDFEKFDTSKYMEQDAIHSASGIGSLDTALRIFKGRGEIFNLPDNPTIDMLSDAYQAGFVNGANWYKEYKKGKNEK
jgi:hypothetical protein